MIHWWQHPLDIYLHRDPVDFRKSINGLSIIIDETMSADLYSNTIFVFCNKSRDKLKVLYWDKTGFALWYKRLEKDKFKWPREHSPNEISLSHEQWDWLLRGSDINALKPHEWAFYSGVT